MRNRRGSERHILQKPGRLILNGIPYSCTIYDLSKTGARIIKSGILTLPETFLIQHPHAATRPCWVIWQDEKQAGVSFDKPSTASDAGTGNAKLD